MNSRFDNISDSIGIIQKKSDNLCTGNGTPVSVQNLNLNYLGKDKFLPGKWLQGLIISAHTQGNRTHSTYKSLIQTIRGMTAFRCVMTTRSNNL